MYRPIYILVLVLVCATVCVPRKGYANDPQTATAIWRSGSTTIPKESRWEGTSFAAPEGTISVGTWRVVAGAEAPTRDEIIVVGVDGGSVVTGMMCDGTTWSALPFNPLATVTESFWWGFGVAYERHSGRAMVVWNNGSTGTEGLSYRLWDGTSWTPEGSITTPIAGEPKHLRLAANPTSNEMVLVASNQDSKDYALVWDGSAWGDPKVLDNSGVNDDRTDISVAYEQQSGRAVVTCGWGLTAVYWTVWDGGTWSTLAGLAKPADADGIARWTTLASDPNSDRIALGVLTANQNAWLCVWNGSSWGVPVTGTTSATGSLYPAVAVAFEGGSGTALAAYGEGNRVRYRTWTDGAGWSGELPVANIGAVPNTILMAAAPDSGHVMLSVQDDANDLNFILWNGTAWGLPGKLETDTGEAKNQPFVYLWDVNDTPPRSYYVSPSGSDANDGLSPVTAWFSLDNGEKLGVLSPGDTVNVLPGLYVWNNSTNLTTSGTALRPILYRRLGTGTASLRYVEGSGTGIVVHADHIVIDSLDVGADQLSGLGGICIEGDSCTVSGCLFRRLPGKGCAVTGSHNLLLRNTIYDCGSNGIENAATGFGNLYYSNTVSSNTSNGIRILGADRQSRIFNNIITQNGLSGIVGGADNVAGFNDVWGNGGAAFTGGVVDSAGGMSLDPQLADPVSGDFGLKLTSPAIDAGLDLGYAFSGLGPDMGAVETQSRGAYYVSPSGDDANSGLSTTTAWFSIDNGDRNGILVPGDTVNVLPGTYTPGAYLWLASSGTSSHPIIYRKLGEASAVVDLESIAQSVILAQGSHLVIDGMELTGSGHKCVYLSGDSCTVANCYIHDNAGDGIFLEGQGNTICHNRIAFCGGDGICAQFGAVRNFFANNTIHSCASEGIYVQPGIISSRIFNNIVTSNLKGVACDPVNVCAFNDVWANTGGNYAGGAADSAGGISADPLFIGAATGDFGLGIGSPAIDAGLDLGYPFEGLAPDMGAIESDYPPVVAYITVEPDTGNVTEGTSRQFLASGYSADSTFIEDLTDSVAWSTTDPSGAVTSGGLYTAGHDLSPPDYHVVADYGAMSDSGLVTVVTDGTLDRIAVELPDGRPLPDTTLTTDDDGAVLYCRGYDSGGNPLGDQPASWAVVGGDSIGVVVPETGTSTVLVLSRPGTGRVVAVGGGLADTTGTITVVAGEMARIDVVPDESIVVETTSFQFYAYAYDADSNLISDSTEDADWATTDPSGSVSGTGLYAAGGDLSPPVYQVRATVGTLQDSSAVTVVSSGSLRYVRIEHLDGTEFGDTTLTTDVDGTGLYCRGYDSADSLLGQVAATWSVVGDDSIGTVTGGPAPQTNLMLTKPGVGWVAAACGAGVADTTGVITCLSGTPAVIEISPDTATVSAGDSLQFDTATRDADGNPSTPVSVDLWEALGGIGSISDAGLFTAHSIGTGAVACRSGALADTTGTLIVISGILAFLDVNPDSAVVDLGGTVAFEAYGLDAFGNPTDCGDLAWSVIGGVGSINAAGIFIAQSVGTGRISATSSINGVSDTNLVVIVVPSNLGTLVVKPDTASVQLGGSVRFSAIGFDSEFNPMPAGDVAWEVIGEIGTIDASGLFSATTPGFGRIAATSSISGLADTTNMIVVEIPTLTVLPLGNETVHAGQTRAPILAFRISNAFATPKNIEGITVRNGSRGYGTKPQVRSNIDSVALFIAPSGGVVVGPGASPIASGRLSSGTISLGFPAVTIGPGSGRTFIVTIRVSGMPRDGDSLDMFVVPSTDIQVTGGTPVAGPDTANSMGCAIIDGLVAQQIRVISAGNSSVGMGSGMFHALTVDIPRNGYTSDELSIFAVFNAGSADTFDLDSLVLYRDDGDGAWGGGYQEQRVGNLSFTGGQWEISGLALALPGEATRFHLGARLSDTPTNGATIALGIPLHGFEMESNNDGPIDRPVSPADTITIVSSQIVTARVIPLPAGEIVPGRDSGPILAVEFTNAYAGPVHIDSLRLEVVAHDPDGASRMQLDSQIETIRLWRNRDGDYDTIGPADSLLCTGLLTGGAVVLRTGGAVIPQGATRGYFVEIGLDLLNGKNGNTMNLRVPTQADVFFGEAVTLSGTFPLANPEPFLINAFPAAGMTLNAVPGTTFFSGQTDGLLLDFALPRNGYAPDILRSIKVLNMGTAAGDQALAALSLWADATGEGFSPDDLRLGEFDRDGSGWVLENLTYPLAGNANRFFVTADINDDFQGGTLRLEIPIRGVGYWSGTDGPDDMPLGNTETHFVLPTNRITAISIPGEPGAVHPGQLAQVLSFALYNGYVDKLHTLQRVRFSNASRSKSDASFADYELGQVSLYYDQNANRVLDADLLLATGYFDGGKLAFNGLNAPLPAESLSYFFVRANVPLGVIDGDTLAVVIEEHADFSFGQAVNLNGDLPLGRGGSLVIDGSVRSQYKMPAISSNTLSPGDTGVTLFAFSPALNGDQVDTLATLHVTNAGDADTSDIAGLGLWLDRNGDDAWQPSDAWLGDFAYTGAGWYLGGIGLELRATSPTLFVTGEVGAWATPNASFCAEIPIGGFGYTSANDGPIDLPLTCSQTLTISSSSLRVTYEGIKPRYSLGQDLSLTVRVTNMLAMPIDDVGCETTVIGDPNCARFDSTHGEPADLIPGGVATFTFFHTAAREGCLRWRIRAFSASSGDSSAVVETGPILIQTVPTGVGVELVSSVPTAVTRGQTHVFPMSIRCRHLDAPPYAASARLDSLVVTVEDGTGAEQGAGTALSRMVLASGYTNLAIVENLGSEAAVVLRFGQPVILGPGEERVVSLQVDIDSLAEASGFALALRDAGAMRFRDSNTGDEVGIQSTTAFPLRTASCAITDPSQYLGVSYICCLPGVSNYGQQGVETLKLALRHGGEADNSQIQLTRLSVEIVDQSGTPIKASDVLDRMELRLQQALIGEASALDLAQKRITLALTAPPVLSPGQIDTVKIRASIAAGSGHSAWGLRIADSTWFVARDISSGAVVPAAPDPEPANLGKVFPIFSGYSQLMNPAGAPSLCLTSKLPASVIAGSDAIGMVELKVACPACYQCSPVKVLKVGIGVLDTLGRALDPYQMFDRIGYRVDDGPPEFETSVQVVGGRTVFHLGQNGVVISSGQVVRILLLADLEADAPFDHFMLSIDGSDAITLVDGTDAGRDPTFSLQEECGGMPFTTDVCRIFLPAGRPVVRVTTLPVRVGHPGEKAIVALKGELTYPGSSVQGDLVMKRWQGRTLMRTDAGLVPVTADQVFDAVRLLLNDRVVATDSSFREDSLALDINGDYVLTRGARDAVELVCDLRSQVRAGNYLIEFGDSSFAEFMDYNLHTEIHPVVAGTAMPLRTTEILVAGNGLASSFTNWPNPFGPPDENTTIGFVLERDAVIDIEIFTLTGELVKRVVAGDYRAAGSYNTDTWSGRNESDHPVLSGAYFCRIRARYTSGGSDEVRRKVAVVR